MGTKGANTCPVSLTGLLFYTVMWRENYTVIIIIIMSSKVKENLKKSLKNPLQRVNFLRLEPCFIVLPPEAQ